MFGSQQDHPSGRFENLCYSRVVPKRKDANRRGFFSSRQAAAEMQTSIQNVTHLRHKGIVAGEFDRVSRRWWYTKKEVHAALEYLKTSRPMHFGELYGRAFDAYAEGQAPRDVVRALRIPLARALTLLQEFEPGHVVIPPEHVLEMRALLKARGMRAGNSSELVSALERLCKRDALLAHIELEAAD